MRKAEYFSPRSWISPKYNLGELVEQGLIVGVFIPPPGSRIAALYDRETVCVYSVVRDFLCEEIEEIAEENINPASEEVLQRMAIEAQEIIDAYSLYSKIIKSQFRNNKEVVNTNLLAV